MTTRTLTLRLTEAQFSALAGAIALRGQELADGRMVYDPPVPDWVREGNRALAVERRVLRNAWSEIRRAWYEAGS